MDPNGERLADMIMSAARAYAAGVAERQLLLQPDVFERYGTSGFSDLRSDTQLRLVVLAEALAAGHPEILEHEVAWQKVALTARDVPIQFLHTNVTCTRDELAANLPDSERAVEYLERARAHLESAPTELPSLLVEPHPHAELTQRYLLALLETRRDDAVNLMLDAFEGGVEVSEIHDVIARAQTEIGRMWQMAEIHVGEEHYSTAVTAQLLAQLRTRMPRRERNDKRVLCTTVGGNLHEIGVQLVADRLEMAGWDVLLLGPSMPAPDLIRSVHDFDASLLAVAASMSTQVRATAALIGSLRENGAADLPILVGGASFSSVPELWRAVGADACALTAEDSVAAAARLCCL